jgi:hypothetical protein
MDEPLQTVELPYLPVPVFVIPKLSSVNVGLADSPRFLMVEWAYPCWIPNGFPAGEQPKIRVRGQVISLRRLVWAQERYPVPSWVRLWSSCKEPLCVQPRHLIPKDADLNKRSRLANWERDSERITEMLSNPTPRLREAMDTGFLLAGSAKPFEFNAYREYCQRAERPFIEAYPHTRAIRVRNLPAAFDAANLAAIRFLASYHGSPKATVSEAPDGFRIGNLHREHVADMASAVADYFADEFGVDWAATPIDAATERAEAIITDSTPIPTATDLLQAFVPTIPEAGEPASALAARFNDYRRSTDPEAPALSNKALAPLLASAGLHRKRTNAGMVWLRAG